MGVSQGRDNHARMHASFGWHVPARFNIAQACCTRWARDADAGRRVAIRAHGAPAGANTLTYRALQDQADRLSHVLSELGVRRGQRVAIVMPQRFETAIAYMAVLQMGAVAMPLSMLFGPDALEYRLRDSETAVAICDESSVANLLAIRAQCPALRTLIGVGAAALQADLDWCSELDRFRPGFPAVETSADDGAVLIYTSGTTGRPKGVMLDHANVAAMCAMTVAGLGVTASDHSLLVLPLFHVNGIIIGALTPLLAGGRVTVAGRFSPKTFFGIVERVRPTYFSAVPAIYALLTSLPEAATADTSSLRLVVCGAAPMPPELIARVERTLGVVLVEGYGLSEGSCASTLNPFDGVRKPGTVGLPLPGQEVRVVDAGGVPVPQGERGEVVIRGANVMRGYLNRPEATAKTIVRGWLRTGDVGIFDADGYLRIVDRIKDMIIRGGENIYPKEIETALYGHDGVLEAAVVGRPDDVLGEVVVAYVALRPGSDVTADELHAVCAGRLARYKRPALIEVRAELPKNAVGKVDKPALRALAAG